MRTPKAGTKSHSMYIDADKTRGIKYDWRKVMKLYKALKCPQGFYDPCTAPIQTAKYNIIYSARGGGKTINVQLLGMCLYWLYGGHIIYIRDTYEQIAQKSVEDMFSVINEYGYISKITDNRWNSCFLKARRWYFCKVDAEGNIIEKDNDHFMFMCSIDQAKNLKSGFNDPMADYIIYDEFIPTDRLHFVNDTFVKFCDLLSTLIRQRYSPVIWMLANNTDKESQYFYEFEIADYVKKMKIGDHKEFTTDKGTPCYIEWYNPDVTEIQKFARKQMNQFYFGFKNPRLGAITNEDWQITPKQHIPDGISGKDFDIIMRNIYILRNGNYVRLDIVSHRELGIIAYAHWASKTYPDSVILTLDDRYDGRYVFGFGTGRLKKLIACLISENRIYYASNDIASFLDAYQLNFGSRLAR